MDRMTKSSIKDFVKNMEIEAKDIEALEKKELSRIFEYFSAYTIISKFNEGYFDLADTVSGGSNDIAIDSIAIIAGGVMVNNFEEAQDLFEKASKIPEVEFIIIQSKISSNFAGVDIRNFGDGVKDLFSENPLLLHNEFIKEKRKITEYIIENAVKVGSFSCRLFYVTTGVWQRDRNILGKIEMVKQTLQGLSIFDNITFDSLGAKEIRDYYRQTKEKVTATIIFSDKVTLPEMNGVTEAYIGFLPVSEYLKLIEDETGTIRKSVFYDNVRDFQGGENEVNKKIANTITSETAGRLVILNNGVTIITKEINQARMTFTLKDYQIVNGCQTSHVIFNNKEELNKDICIPVKIICTEDEEAISQVIVANNSQTEIKKEALLAMNDFQKELEVFYNSVSDSHLKLYYERRSKQFDTMPNVEKVRIISIATQIKSFAAMFLDKPHQASRYFGQILDNSENEIFNDSHNLMPYYTSALGLYKLEFYFRNKNLDSVYRKFRFHLLMMLKYYICSDKLSKLNSKKVSDVCDVMNRILLSDKAEDVFRFLIDMIEASIENPRELDISKKSQLVDTLIIKAKSASKQDSYEQFLTLV
ncbi:AIPR family protein [Listeria booriae]|uniref:AIPR family protein n=1 Tax=Listeria booriae TaxID=1552123 RepID=A0A842EWN1_9LIST|nr:AIPR family protein [Listeria booriae]MBC2242497.1 AIPR family protein [Listeria booriae]